MKAPGSVRVIACGMTESGKDYLLRRLFLNRHPRSVVLDPLGEYAGERPPGGARLYHAGETLEGLRRALARAAREGPRWRVIAAAPAELAPAVGRLLCPPVLEPRRSFVALAGGVALHCSELDLFAPTAATSDVTGLWRRGRHIGLTILGASQRPHGISRTVTAMSRFLLVCRTQEPRDLRYLEQFLPAGAMHDVTALPWQWALLCDTRAARWVVLDRAQRIVRQGAAAPPPLT